MSKVFCGQCRHLIEPGTGRWACFERFECKSNPLDSPLRAGAYRANPFAKNEGNNCAEFAPKLALPAPAPGFWARLAEWALF